MPEKRGSLCHPFSRAIPAAVADGINDHLHAQSACRAVQSFPHSHVQTLNGVNQLVLQAR